MFKQLFQKNKAIVITSLCSSISTALIIFIVAENNLFGSNGRLLNLPTASDTTDETKLERNDRSPEELRIMNTVERASPAVVSIVVTKDVPIIEQYYEEFDPFDDDPFDHFFGGGFGFRMPQQRQRGTEKREVGGGSGFFISANGYVVTNKHVVDDEDAEYTVLTNDGEKHKADILAKDSMLDIAILKVAGNDFPHLPFGDSDSLKPGQTVIAIGNALGEFRNSVSTGIISGISRSIVAGDVSGRSEQLDGVIQTDAAINPGNSGGPLLDTTGAVIGVNVAVERGAENIGFALPSNAVKTVADSVRKHGEIIRPYLGIRYMQITEALKEKNNLPVDHGILVQRGGNADELAVIPGSPADKAGIVENDIILAVDGVELKHGTFFAAIIRQRSIGETIRLTILHKGVKKEMEVKLEKAPADL